MAHEKQIKRIEKLAENEKTLIKACEAAHHLLYYNGESALDPEQRIVIYRTLQKAVSHNAEHGAYYARKIIIQEMGEGEYTDEEKPYFVSLISSIDVKDPATARRLAGDLLVKVTSWPERSEKSLMDIATCRALDDEEGFDRHDAEAMAKIISKGSRLSSGTVDRAISFLRRYIDDGKREGGYSAAWALNANAALTTEQKIALWEIFEKAAAQNTSSAFEGLNSLMLGRQKRHYPTFIFKGVVSMLDRLMEDKPREVIQFIDNLLERDEGLKDNEVDMLEEVKLSYYDRHFSKALSFVCEAIEQDREHRYFNRRSIEEAAEILAKGHERGAPGKIVAPLAGQLLIEWNEFLDQEKRNGLISILETDADKIPAYGFALTNRILNDHAAPFDIEERGRLRTIARGLFAHPDEKIRKDSFDIMTDTIAANLGIGDGGLLLDYIDELMRRRETGKPGNQPKSKGPGAG